MLADTKKKVNVGQSVISVSPNVLHSLSKAALTAEKLTTRPKKEALTCLEFPSWTQERQHLSWDFYPNLEKFDSVSIFLKKIIKN